MKIIFWLLMSLGWVGAGELRLVSYNIHHGQGLDGKLDLVRIARVIKKHQPDFVALQEVDNKASRSGKVDQAAELAKLLGMKHVLGKCINLGGGGYGNAIHHGLEDGSPLGCLCAGLMAMMNKAQLHENNEKVCHVFSIVSSSTHSYSLAI